MKRKSLITALVSFACVCVFGGAAACTTNGGNNGDKPVTDEILLAGFEDYDELLTYHYTNYFGAAKPQKDFVTQGTGGVALTINGQFSNSQKPTLVIETRTELLEKGDFSDVSEIKLDVKNENDYAANIYFQYVSSTETGKKSSSAIRQTVAAGYEGTITFSIDRALMSEFLDLSKVTELRLLFDSPRVAIPTLTSQIEAQQNYRKFKADNLRAVTTSAPIEEKAVRKEGEIESADKEEYLAAWYMPSSYIWSPASMAFNTDKEYIKGGEGSLKVIYEGTQRGEGVSFTAPWMMSINPNADISEYYALHFWLYNDSVEENKITFYLYNINASTSAMREHRIGYLKPGWNEFTFTVNELRDIYGYDDKNFLFGFNCVAPGGKDHVLYLDEMYLLPFTNPEITVEGGENVGNLYYKAYAEGDVITLPTPTVKYASGYETEVLAPNGEKVAVTNNQFTAASKGEYTVTYTATGNDGKTAKTSILLAVGSVPTFNNAPQNVYTLGNKTYTITDKALATASVSWEVQLYRHRFVMSESTAGIHETSYNGNGYKGGVMTGNPTSFYAANGYDCRVIWTATNADGLRAVHTQHIFADDELLSLDERYGETLYNPQRVGGAISVNESKTAFVIQSDTTKAEGVIDNPLKVGYLNTMLRFVVYNRGENPVTVKVNNSTRFTLGAKSYGLLNSDLFGKDGVIGWGLTTADGKMGELKFTFTSETEGLNLEISRFGVNKNAFTEPTLVAPTYEEYYAKGGALNVKKPIVSGLTLYQFKVYKPDGTTAIIGMSDDGTPTDFTVKQTGTYRIEYSATYEDYNGELQTLTATVTFTVIDFDLSDSVYASHYETGEQIILQKATGGEYNVTVTKQGVATPVLTCTHTELASATPPSFKAGTGMYTITYSVDYTDKGEIKTYTKVYTFTVSPNLSGVIANAYKVLDYNVSAATMRYTLTDEDKPSQSELARLSATLKNVTVDSFSRDNFTKIGSSNSKNDKIFVKDSATDKTISPVINGTDLSSFNVRNGYSYRITYTLEIDGEEFAVYRTILAMRRSEYISLSAQYATFYTNAKYNTNIQNGGMSLGADNKSFMLTGEADGLAKGCFQADASVYLGTATTLKMFIYNNSNVDSFVYFGSSAETSPCRLAVAAHHFTVFNIALSNSGAWYFVDTATKTFKANPVYVYGGSEKVDIRFVEIAVDSAADFTKE